MMMHRCLFGCVAMAAVLWHDDDYYCCVAGSGARCLAAGSAADDYNRLYRRYSLKLGVVDVVAVG